MAAVANLLRVPIPSTYDESRVPERSSLALLAGVKVPSTQGMLFNQQHLHRPPVPTTGPLGMIQGPPGMIQGPPQALGHQLSAGKACWQM